MAEIAMLFASIIALFLAQPAGELLERGLNRFDSFILSKIDSHYKDRPVIVSEELRGLLQKKTG